MKKVRVRDSAAPVIVARIAEPQLLSVVAAADLTGIASMTWRKYCYSGKIASVKIGDRLLIPRTEVQRIIDEGYRPSVAEQERKA
jgi:excisionase family DNA binding protein